MAVISESNRQGASERPDGADEPDFVFSGTTTMLPGLWARAYDAYVEGEMAKINSAITVVNETETPELNQTSLQRWLIESPLYPAALLPGGDVTWEPVDDRRARGVVTAEGMKASLIATFRADGSLEHFDAERDGDLTTSYHGSGEHVTREDYRPVDGVMIPHRFTIARAAARTGRLGLPLGATPPERTVPRGTSMSRPMTRNTADRAPGGERRRGRPRAGERELRRRRILDAAFDELLEHGYDKLTMLGIASRAGASKETLYTWFGDREGLFAALIQDNADGSAEAVRAALSAAADPRETLIGYATGLLGLLTSPRSIALNRAAMTSPELARILLESGRHRIGPLVEHYLAQVAGAGQLDITDTDDAFRLLYGLVVQDTQIRTLLGEPAPSAEGIAERARGAVEHFLRLTAPRRE
jgi:AcrR family transcriptional regulator